MIHTSDLLLIDCSDNGVLEIIAADVVVGISVVVLVAFAIVEFTASTTVKDKLSRPLLATNSDALWTVVRKCFLMISDS